MHVRFGRLDYAVNNAGIEWKFAGIVNLPEQEWDRVLRYGTTIRVHGGYAIR